MTEYETIIVLHPDLGEAGWKEFVQRVRTILETGKAEISSVEEWGLRELAYRIEKQGRGFYALFTYKAEHAAVTELERQLGISDPVLRFLTVRKLHRRMPPPRKPQTTEMDEADEFSN